MCLPASPEGSFPPQHPMARKRETNGNETGNEMVSSIRIGGFATKYETVWKRAIWMRRKRAGAFRGPFVSIC